MTDSRTLSDALASAAEVAGRALVQVGGHCRRRASGSLYDASGVVLTTARAVAGLDSVDIISGASTVTGAVAGYDLATDIGLVKIDADLGSGPVWSDAPPRLGAIALAASRPGRGVRVRLGVVSQVGESWHTPRGGRIERYVETSVAPEPGFSGGLSFDVDGRVVGMHSAALLRGVPVLLEKSTISRITSAILADGRVKRGYLGVGTQAVRLPAPVASGQGVGLLVSSVQPGSAADRAGLMLGDVLLTFRGAVLSHATALQAALEDAEDTALPLTLLRAGKLEQLEVTPGARP